MYNHEDGCKLILSTLKCVNCQPNPINFANDQSLKKLSNQESNFVESSTKCTCVRIHTNNYDGARKIGGELKALCHAIRVIAPLIEATCIPVVNQQRVWWIADKFACTFIFKSAC